MSHRPTGRTRLAYSTETGSVCPRCGWPTRDCRCGQKVVEVVPDKLVARLRVEKAGRKGKTVTVVDGMPKNPEFLRGLAGELKKACASGGAVGEGRVEVQGDHREAIRTLLVKKGWSVKG